MIIGITGTLGAGKGEVSRYLMGKGFKHFSARDFITEEIKRRGLPVNRDQMVEVANDLRASHGASYIATELYDQAAKFGANAVIESIRTVGEVMALRKKGNFTLLAVDADPKVRYERVVARDSATDQVSFEKFLADEALEYKNPDPNKQNLALCMELADFVITNNGNLEELRKNIDAIMERLEALKPF
jgi:dephospho-CoA kinase